MRWRTIEQLGECLARGLLPVIPAQRLCGASGDLAPMVENVINVIAIELLTATQALEFHAPLASSVPLECVRAVRRAHVAALDEDSYLASDIAAAAALVRNDAIAAAADIEDLPSIGGDRRS